MSTKTIPCQQCGGEMEKGRRGRNLIVQLFGIILLLIGLISAFTGFSVMSEIGATNEVAAGMSFWWIIIGLVFLGGGFQLAKSIKIWKCKNCGYSFDLK